MKNSHLITTLDLVWMVSYVIPEFVKKGRWMGSMTTLERVFHILRIIVNQ